MEGAVHPLEVRLMWSRYQNACALKHTQTEIFRQETWLSATTTDFNSGYVAIQLRTGGLTVFVIVPDP